jgi:hypothetical protein
LRRLSSSAAAKASLRKFSEQISASGIVLRFVAPGSHDGGGGREVRPKPPLLLEKNLEKLGDTEENQKHP